MNAVSNWVYDLLFHSRYLSYKQFYVLFHYYEKADRDYDSLIIERDLISYDFGDLTPRIVARIFQMVVFMHQFCLRLPGSSLVRLEGGWIMKILFTSCFQWRADHLIKPSNEYWYPSLDFSFSLIFIHWAFSSSRSDARN